MIDISNLMAVRYLGAWCSAIFLAILAAPAIAQSPSSDAERLRREQREGIPLLTPPQSTPLNLNFPEPPQDLPPSGGPRYRINSILFKGNTVYSSEALTAELGNFSATDLDLSGMTKLANRITAYYRRNGYVFARAFIPEQALSANQLLIEVVEGRFNTIKVSSSDAELVERAQMYLGELQSGALIESEKLERALLVLSDVPGIRIQSLFRPGSLQGSGDLVVEANRQRRWDAKIEMDNLGGRFTGLRRTGLEYSTTRLFIYGDRFLVRTVYTDEDLWLASLNYELPLGTGGWRASLGWDRTGYKLTDDFSGFRGRASDWSFALSYPLLRSQLSNAYLSLEYNDSNSKDFLGGFFYGINNATEFRPVIRFDSRDDWLGGGSYFGSVSFVTGSQKITGVVTSKSHFHKYEGQLARVQQLPGSRALFLNLLFQLGSRNLSTSEGFTLGGSNRVRAYTSSESQGGRGYVGQVEFRFMPEPSYPFIFYDIGRVSARTDGESRKLQGAGVGMRFQQKQFFGDFSLAWRTYGGNPLADSVGNNPKLWLKLGYKF